METKKYLKQLKRIDLMIKNKLQEIQQLREMLVSTGAKSKEVNVQTSTEYDKLGSAVAKIVDTEREINDMVNDYTNKRNLIISQIDSIEDLDFYNVLSERYVFGKDWKTIEVNMNRSHRQVMSIHGKALLEFERMFGKTYN